MFIAVLFVYKFIPETKEKTLEEIQYFFHKRKEELLNAHPVTNYGTYLNETTSEASYSSYT